MTHHVIEFDQTCPCCTGTGLFVGMAERDGAAVVCHDCNGTGCQHTKIGYDTFEGRRDRPGVRRVWAVNPGICIGTNLGQYHLDDFGGMLYRDWAAGQPFPPGSEMRKFTCPAWWYQSADYTRKPDWPECKLGRFSDCSSYRDKAGCWQRWDREFGVQP
jgi:hypothetical protein